MGDEAMSDGITMTTKSGAVVKKMKKKQNKGEGLLLGGVHGLNLVAQWPWSTTILQETRHHQKFDGSSSSSTLHHRHGPQRSNQSQQLILQNRKEEWHRRLAGLRPIIPNCICTSHTGDKNFSETLVNVVTSLPFIVLGLQAPRKNQNSKIYANSLIGVGVASSCYHASRGTLRKYLRWADYTMIATATVCFSRAIRSENPRLLMAASTLILPIRPLMVSVLHTGMMEVAFAKRALSDPDLRLAHNVHKVSSLLGGALFIADGMLPQTPYLHAGWHLAAALGVTTCNKLLE